MTTQTLGPSREPVLVLRLVIVSGPITAHASARASVTLRPDARLQLLGSAHQAVVADARAGPQER